MTRRKWLVALAIAVVPLVAWSYGRAARPKDEMMELYGVFVDAVEQVEANYVQAVPRKQLLESALKGMLAELDEHSVYFTEPEWVQFRKQIEGSFTGIGISIEIDPETGRLKVLAPLPGSPAYQAGILPDDQILEVDGKTTEGITHDKAIEALQGRPGTQVRLKILHADAPEPVEITLTRAIIELPSVIGDSRKPDNSFDFMLDKERKIGYIRVTNFIQDTPEDLKKALEELTAQGMKGLILDLRDDPGGLLEAAVKVADLFLEDGLIVTTRGRNQRDEPHEAEREGTFADVPMVVLVNQRSASASEIVAAALQDHGRAAIVGQRTYGKGSVQRIVALANGTSILKLTVATYWRPSGKNIHRFKNSSDDQEWGVSPDPGNEVKLTPKEYEAWVRARQERDLTVLRSRPAGEARKGQEPKKIEDRQLDKALEVLRARMTPKAPAAAAD